MADPKIKVEIGAVADGLIKNVDGSIRSLEQLQRELDDLDKKLRTAADPTEIINLNKQIGSLKAGMQSLRTAGIDPLTRATSNYNSVGIDFARIIQDAPFGIIGVSNNITQLASSFQNARASGQSFNSILGSIFSAGNILTLGISAITTALVLYEQGVFDFTKSNEEATKSLKDLANEIDNAESRSIAEITTINALRSIIEDETLARDKRLSAIDRLQKRYPEIFRNADREKLLNGQLITSYDLLTKSIIQRAEADLATKRIPELNKEKQVIDNQIIALQKKLELEQAILKATSQVPSPSGLAVATGTTAGTGTGVDLFAIQSEKVKKLESEIRSLSTTSKGLQINIDGFAESIVSYNEEFANILDPLKSDFKELKTDVDNLKRSFEDLSNLPRIGLPGSNLEDLARQLRARREQLQTGGLVDPNSLQNAIANAPGISTTLPITGIASQFQTEADKIKTTVEDLSQAFTGLGSLIGKAFENPQLGTFLGQFASFAAKLIATNFKIAGSNAVAGATSAAAATGPAAPFTLAGFIAASLGLVASAFSAFGGSRSGGGSFSGASGMGTSFAGGGQGLQFDRSLNLVGEFRVKGQDLVYVFNEANSKNRKG
jgi:hypothetical protein